MRIDLNGAHLIDLDFSNCRVENADFRNTQFSGYAWFGGAHFSGYAWFEEAEFSGDARFAGAQFSGYAWFGRAQFSGDAWFIGAQFKAQLDLEDAEASHPNDRHVWPDGWQIEPSSRPGMARLVRKPQDA